jgi:aerobic-type carbon monoxide dehydrogenase small subunit (CoxS/CutS family)
VTMGTSARVISLWVNERAYTVELAPHRTLLELLTEELGLPGTKNGCSQGVCGACTVLLDGQPVRACLALAVRAAGRRVTTVEGLAADGALHRLQQAFVDEGAVQCGFCTPGILMAAVALLDEVERPSEAEVRDALIGNLCRCTGYASIVRAVVAASRSEVPAS